MTDADRPADRTGPPVAAVVLNWNQAGLTLDCLAALRRSARPVDHLVVVDNGSRPDQRAALAAGLPAAARLVRLPANRGFAGGMNAGLAEAGRLGAEYAWLVNNDAFPDPGCLGLLLAAMDADPTLAAVTPRLVGTDGREQPAGGRWLPSEGRTEFLMADQMATPVGGDGYWAVGTAPLVRVGPCARAGGFDDRFFAYGEEVDLCLRLGRQGYRFRAVPDATAVHLGQGSSADGTTAGGSPFADYLGVRNLFQQVHRHPPPRHRRQLVLRMAAKHLDNAGCFQLRGQSAKATATVQGLLAVLLGESGSPRWYGRGNRVAGFVARHPWLLIRLLDRLGQSASAGRATGGGR
ncbi:MAG: glycosyltransferase family 2 protein [Gemmataceae bacterium]